MKGQAPCTAGAVAGIHAKRGPVICTPHVYLVVAVRAVAYILSHTGRLASRRKECMAFLCSLLSLLELPVQHAVLLPRMEE